MAYSVKGLAIINDSRALLGVSTAGINTALYVGEEILADGASGIVTAKGMVVKTGDLNIEDGGNLIIGTGGSITAEGIFLEVDGESVGVATIAPGGNLQVANIETTGYVSVGAGLTLNGSLTFTGSEADEFVTGITTDLDESAGANELITAEGTKSYVDAKIGGGALLEIEGDNGVQGEIDLANDEVFGLAGTANQIDSNIAGVGFNTVTFALSNELQLPGTLAFGAGQAVSVVGVETSLVDGVAGVATNTSLPTQLAVKTYVDAQIAETGGTVSFAGDSGSGSFDISDEVFKIVGTANEVVTSGAGLTVTIGLPDDVTIPNLTVGTGLSFTGGDADEIVSGITTNLDESATASELATAEGVKSYVDAQVGGNTNAESIDVADNQDNVVYSVPFVSATGAGASMYSDASQLQYNPSTGLLVAQDFNSLSDIRFKENVETITGATAKLEQIRGVEFDWKNVEGSSVGVIAQEVQALYPQLVTQGEEKLTVNYNGLTGLLIEAVKELTARVAELEGKA